MKKYVIGIASAIVIAIVIVIIMVIIVNVFINLLLGVDTFGLCDFFAKEYTLDLNLYDSYAVDTSGLREYDRKRSGNYEYKELNEPFTYFLQLPLDKDILDTSSRDLQFALPDELLDYVYSSETKHEFMLISIGRKLERIDYKYLCYFNDGVNAKAKITFEEQHQNDMAYVYFIDKNVFFWSADYYVMDDSQQKFLGENLYFTY